jgi:hypothetical protein
MAWTTIPNSDIDQDSPITQTLMTALRDNPIAIANGDTGAPRVAAIAAMSHEGAEGAVGTYAFCRRTSGTGDVSFGGTLAGSSLSPTSAFTRLLVTNTTFNPVMNTGSSLSGTWRAMGTYDHVDAPVNGEVGGATLWLRIS